MNDRTANRSPVTRASGPSEFLSNPEQLQFSSSRARAGGPCHNNAAAPEKGDGEGFRRQFSSGEPFSKGRSISAKNVRLRGDRFAGRCISQAARNLPRPLFLCLLMALLAGCQSDPFTRPTLPALHNPNPQNIRQSFPLSLPDEFTSDDTIVLQFPLNIKFAMLGVLNVNRPANTFEFYALNQAGVAYFHLSGHHGNVGISDALGPWMQHKDILLSIAQDIQNIYLAPSPEPGAHVTIKPTLVRFDQKSPGGYLIYDFGGQPITLLQKQLGGFFGPAWTARYYDYQPNEKGKLFPRGIVLDNSRFFYRLIIKNRDWSTDEQP